MRGAAAGAAEAVDAATGNGATGTAAASPERAETAGGVFLSPVAAAAAAVEGNGSEYLANIACASWSSCLSRSA